jgi:GT2 family glycosyltransferase
MSARAVTAIVVAFNSAQALSGCIEPLSREGVPVVVVDNASTDETVAVAERLGAQVVRNRRNEGYGRANNVGVRSCDSEFVLVINPDCTIEPGAVDALVNAAAHYPDAGVFAPKIVEPNGRVFFQPRSLLAPYLQNPRGQLVIPEGEACVPFVSGACFLIRRELFMRLGGFDENIFLFYEDDDLCRRVADSGAAIIYVPEAVARHGRGKSSGASGGVILKSRWHQAWSRAYVSRKYGLRNPAPAMFLLNAFKALGAILIFQRKLVERYGGSAAGAWAFLKGQTALEAEGLVEAERWED